MEKEIKKLKELADEFAEFVGRSPIERHIYLLGEAGDRNNIRLYFTKEREYSINLFGVCINEYNNKIEFPLNYTSEDFEKIYDKAKKYLEESKDNIVKQKDKAIEDEIEYLKRQLEDLENKKL